MDQPGEKVRPDHGRRLLSSRILARVAGRQVGRRLALHVGERLAAGVA